MVAVFGGGGREVVGVGAVGSGAVVPAHPLGGGGLEVVAVLPGAVAPDELTVRKLRFSDSPYTKPFIRI